jgi:histidine kinase/DNA gyrase B/HSP90-like ATPase
MKPVEVLPSARRLIGSLRDIGYDLPVAVADLVDNSIAAGSTTLRLDMYFEGADSWIRLSDDGSGMTEGALMEALRFGSRRRYSTSDLGKFGLGLKVASLSQCRLLTVASRSTLRGRPRIARWDLNHIETTDRWEVIRPPARECPLAVLPLRTTTGTVVLWQRLDRILRFKAHRGQHAFNEFSRLENEIEEHLAMVFHRFLAREAGRRRPLELFINGRRVRPWDPFARLESATQELSEQKLRLIDSKTAPRVAVRPYVLPSEARFSTPSAHRAAAGPQLWNRQQGFYFYRNDRMIQGGGWNRLRTSDEHTKLARISVDFSSSVDQFFELNVSKTQVRVPPSIRAELATIASSVAGIAQTSYRGSSEGDERPAMVANRIDAIRELVGMVISSVQQVIVEELGRESGPAKKISIRLSDLERKVVREVVSLTEIPTSPTGSANGHHPVREGASV